MKFVSSWDLFLHHRGHIDIFIDHFSLTQIFDYYALLSQQHDFSSTQWRYIERINPNSINFINNICIIGRISIKS